MKKSLIIAAVFFQIAALAWMALSREYILQTGETVKFQTAPIDPRDLFRGDFVRLQYAMSDLPMSLLEDPLHNTVLNKGEILFALLAIDKNSIATVSQVRRQPPEDGQAFIKGRVAYRWHPTSSQSLRLKYGIEQYFVEQGKGLSIENKRGTRNSIQLPMIMHVALSNSGTAIIKGHEWSKLGTGLAILQQPEREALPEQASASFKLTLKNMSDEPLSLPLRPGICSFSIISVVTAPERLRRKYKNCDQLEIADKKILPGESLTFEFDFNQPHWWFEVKNKLKPMGKLPWSYRFRIIYDEIDESAVTGSEIISRAFHGRGQID